MYLGNEGSGKTAIFTWLGDIIGRSHFAHIQSDEDIVGEFTAAFDYKTVVFIDECALGKSDMKTRNKLKNIITNKTQRKRLMRQDPTYTNSFANFFMASNNIEQIVPAEVNARRYECYYSDVSVLWSQSDFADQFATPKDYFDTFHLLMDGNDREGVKTFANFLYRLAPYLEDWPANVSLKNKMLAVQKFNNLPPTTHFWIELLRNGSTDIEIPSNGWDTKLFVETLYGQYLRRFEISRKSCKMEDFWRELCELLPSWETDKIRDGGAYKTLINIPELEVCKEYITNKIVGAEYWIEDQDAALRATKLERIKSVTRDELLFGYLPRIVQDRYNRGKLHNQEMPFELPKYCESSTSNTAEAHEKANSWLDLLDTAPVARERTYPMVIEKYCHCEYFESCCEWCRLGKNPPEQTHEDPELCQRCNFCSNLKTL